MTALDKVKNHLKRNKKIYLVGAGSLAVGVVGTALVLHARQVVVNDAFKLVEIRYNSPTTNTLITEMIERSTPSKWTRCVESGIIYPSQKAAARAMDVSPSAMVNHIRGGFDTLKGMHFENVPRPE